MPLFLVPVGPLSLPLTLGQKVVVPLPTAIEITHIAGSIQVGSATIDLSDDVGVFYTLILDSGRSVLQRLDKVPMLDGGVLTFTPSAVGLGAAGCFITVWGTAS